MFIRDTIASILSPHPAHAASRSNKPFRASRLSHVRSSPRTTSPSAYASAPDDMPKNTTSNRGTGKQPSSASKTNCRSPSRMNSTIRPVRSFEDEKRLSEDSSTDGASPGYNKMSALSSSVNSNASMSSVSRHPSQQDNIEEGGRSKGSQQDVSTPRKASPRTDGFRSKGAPDLPSVVIPMRRSSLRVTRSPSPGAEAVTPSVAETPSSANETQPPNGWDSTVGKAGLGKTGRVINKLVSDNEALKRDIKIERLRAEEAKQAARLLEDRMDRMVGDYDSRLLDSNVTKTLLARKERQVESLQSTLELERKRAADACERERKWKNEMEKVCAESKKEVEEATSYAALMEGRYNAISSHWQDQGDSVKRSMGKMRIEIEGLVQERRNDDDRINTLRDLCDQQDGNIRELLQQKEAIVAQFDRYKDEQERTLKDIKDQANQREQEQERMVRETNQVLDQLKWALNVKEKIKWAQ